MSSDPTAEFYRQLHGHLITDSLLAEAMGTGITAGAGLGAIDLRHYEAEATRESADYMPAAAALEASAAPAPFAMLAPGGNGTVEVRTRRQRRALVEAWATHKILYGSRANALIAEIERLCTAYQAERYDSREWRRLRDDMSALQSPSVIRRELQSNARIPARGSLSSDPAVAREELCDRIAEAAEARARFLLDADPGAPLIADRTEQRSALERIERQRRKARRAVRAAATVAAAQTAANSAIGLIDLEIVEHAPAWVGPTGGQLVTTDGRVLTTYAAPASGHAWSADLALARNTGDAAVAGDRHGGVLALDPLDLPAGWSVTLGATGVLRIAYAGTAAPAMDDDAGDIDIVVRNAYGPRALGVRIAVPAPAG